MPDIIVGDALASWALLERNPIVSAATIINAVATSATGSVIRVRMCFLLLFLDPN